MNKKIIKILFMFLLLIVLLIVFVMCAPETSSGGRSSSNNNDTSLSNWNKKFDGSGENDIAYSVAIDSNNNVYVVGYSNNLVSGSSLRDWWIKKFDSNGNEDTTNWDKMFDGNGSHDEAKYVTIDSNNNVYVVGYGRNLISGSSKEDWWIKKFDSNGNEDIPFWNKKIDGSGDIDQAYSVAIDFNNVYVVGYGVDLVSGSSGRDWWIKKFDSSGNEDTTNWNKIFDGNGDAGAYSIAIDRFRNVNLVGYGNNLISGSSLRDWWIKKFNLSGIENTNWNKMFDGNGGNDYAYSVAIDLNENVYIVGHGYNLVSGSSGVDWWIKKFDSNGNEDTTNWNKKFDGNGDANPNSIAIDSKDNVYVVGSGYNLVSGSSYDDWWIVKIDSNGNNIWFKIFDGSGSFDKAYSVAIDSNNNVYVVGYGDNLVSGSSGIDWWIKKFNSDGTEY